MKNKGKDDAIMISAVSLMAVYIYIYRLCLQKTKRGGTFKLFFFSGKSLEKGGLREVGDCFA